MSYFGTTINDSATIVGAAAATLENNAFLAAKFDSNGKIAVADTKGENAVGLFLAAEEGIKAGEDVTVQIKECGLWKAGEAVKAGDELTTDANGKAIKATAGNFITAIALEAANAADDVIKVQIVKAGYKNQDVQNGADEGDGDDA